MLVSQRVKYNEEYKISYTLSLFFQVLSIAEILPAFV